MSVKKNTSNFLKHSGLSFTTIINETMDLITDDGALGIYCYLSSKPENWNICNVHLQNRFNKGRDYIQKKMHLLKKIGAIKTTAIKDDKGKILYWETTLDNVIKTQNTENPYSGKSYPQSTILKTQILEKPESGKTGTSNNRKIQIKERSKKIERTARKKREPLSDDFVFGDANKMLCKERGLNEKEVLAKFKAFYKGKTADDWQNKAQLWVLREKNTKSESKLNQEIRSTVPEYGPGHPTWEALHGQKEKSHGSEISRNNAGTNSVRKAQDYLLR